MKRKIIFVLTFICLINTCTFVENSANVQADSYTVSGGKNVYTFENYQAQYFTTYTQFDKKPWIMDGRFYCWSLCEQKIILHSFYFTDCDVSVDVGTVNDNGKFDAGIYVLADNATPNSIDAINVNVQAAIGSNTYTVNIHKYTTKGYKFIAQSDPVYFSSNGTVRLRVVVKNGMVYAFTDGNKTPRLTYDSDLTYGGIGLRSYYSPNWFDNLEIIGEPFSLNKTEQQELLDQAKAIDMIALTADSAKGLSDAIAQAESATTQYEIDDSVTALKKALDSLSFLRTFDQLTNLISQAKAIINPDGKIYTKNSWKSLQFVINRCEQITDGDENEISYWANRLQNRIDSLIPYKTGGAV